MTNNSFAVLLMGTGFVTLTYFAYSLAILFR
jgi:hypothetical protein